MTKEEQEELALTYYGNTPPETIMDMIWMAQSNFKIAETNGNKQAMDAFQERITLLTIAWDKKAVIV